MTRRDFGLVIGAIAATPTRDLCAAQDSWRTFEVTTRVEILKPSGPSRIWLPMPLASVTPFQKTFSNQYSAEGGAARVVEQKPDSFAMLAVEFRAGAQPAVTLTSRIATKNYAVDLSAPSKAVKADRDELRHFTRTTRMLPTDGIVKDSANRITAGAKSDLAKARDIYEWIVDNTFRDPKTRGCGLGDIRFMLESGDLGGKCADLNALYVGLARAAGLPARDAYGIRVAKSGLGYKSLGASSAVITKAQHCRAEVFISDYGWVPVDPADVRKVALEEPPGNRPLDDEMVSRARTRLFGSWEMNWIAYNFAHDVALPGSSGSPVPFLMYPQAETGEGRIDCLDPDNFKYEIDSVEIAG
jgi:transglutaminase-like putative cysteine protease